MDQRLRVGMTRTKGRGVFANVRIKKGEIIEVAPVILLTQKEEKILEKTRLIHFCYEWEGTEKGKKGPTALALGHASLYNHSYAPNATYYTRCKGRAIVFRALRDIAPGEEITHNYNGDPDDRTPLWFGENSWGGYPPQRHKK